MTPNSDPTPLCPVSLPQDAMDADLRRFRRATLFRLDDAVRDARRGQATTIRLTKKHLPLKTLALYESQHADLRIEVVESPTHYLVSVALRAVEAMA